MAEAIYFKLDEDSLDWDDMIALQSGDMLKAKRLLARFVVDEAGGPVDAEQAEQQLGQLKLSQIKSVMTDFSAKAQLITEGIIPKA